jgi:hypothetical protein
MAGLQILKIDSVTRQPIEGVIFSVSKLNGEKIGEFKTGKDGLIFIDSLEPQFYTVTEIKTAEGYQLDSEPKTIEVKWGENAKLEVENKPVASLLIVKTDMRTDKPLEGVKFDVAKINGEKIGTYETDKNGRIYVNGLQEGKYTVVEAEALEGYELDTKMYEVDIKDGEQTKVELKNKPLSGLRIIKLDSISKKPIMGVEFRINKVVTGTFNHGMKYKIMFKTNKDSDYKVLADNLQTTRNNVIDCRPANFGLYSDEYITEIMFVFGVVKAGFCQVEEPSVYFDVLNGLPNGYQFANRADVGGMHNGEWVISSSSVLTTIYAKGQKMPVTGY